MWKYYMHEVVSVVRTQWHISCCEMNQNLIIFAELQRLPKISGSFIKTATRSGGYSWKPSFVSPSKKRQSLVQFSAGWEKNKQQYGGDMSAGETCRAKQILDGTFKLHSRTDLINSSGCEGKLRASVPQQRNKIPVISSSSSLHSSQALMSCLGNLCALCVYVC